VEVTTAAGTGDGDDVARHGDTAGWDTDDKVRRTILVLSILTSLVHALEVWSTKLLVVKLLFLVGPECDCYTSASLSFDRPSTESQAALRRTRQWRPIEGMLAGRPL
jgi:hypothetical protein